MAETAAEVVVSVTGSVNYAPAGTPVPTDAVSAIPETFTNLGYVSEDGITQTINADTSDIKAWQNGDVVRTVQTSHDISFQLTLIQSNADTKKIYYNDPAASLAEVKVTGAQSPHYAWVLEAKDDTKVIRVCVPDGQVTDRGDVTWKSDEAIGYDITIKAYPDANGVKAYLYQADISGESLG